MSRQRSSSSRRAAEMYLASIADGSRIPMRECAARYQVSVGTVHAVVREIRKTAVAPGEEAMP